MVTASAPAADIVSYALSVHPANWALPASSGRPRVQPGSAVGVHLGASGEAWRLEVTHPTVMLLAYTRTITIDQGTFTNVVGRKLEPTDSYSLSPSGQTITFSFHNFGQLDELDFTASTDATALTLSIDLNGRPATAQQIFLGTSGKNPVRGTPTVRRNS